MGESEMTTKDQDLGKTEKSFASLTSQQQEPGPAQPGPLPPMTDPPFGNLSFDDER
jgi:hypothetical protein